MSEPLDNILILEIKIYICIYLWELFNMPQYPFQAQNETRTKRENTYS